MAKTSRGLVVDKETGEWRFMTWQEEMAFSRENNLRYFGKQTEAGIYYQRMMNDTKRRLDTEESWLRTNPSNKVTQANVVRLRKQYEEYKTFNELFE